MKLQFERNEAVTFAVGAMERPLKRRKGGQRQRLAAAAEQREVEAEQKPNERLADYLKRQWAWGHLSPQSVQSIAAHAIGDMTTCGATDLPVLLKKFAALGTHGQHASNMHQELVKLLDKGTNVPKPLMLNLPFAKGDFLQSMMLPHVLFSHLHQYYPATFQKQFYPEGIVQLKRFWKTFKWHPSMQNHEILHIKNFDSSALPLHLHGDGVPVTGRGKVWCKMMLAFSWSGALSRGNSQESCNLIYSATRKQRS